MFINELFVSLGEAMDVSGFESRAAREVRTSRPAHCRSYASPQEAMQADFEGAETAVANLNNRNYRGRKIEGSMTKRNNKRLAENAGHESRGGRRDWYDVPSEFHRRIFGR